MIIKTIREEYAGSTSVEWVIGTTKLAHFKSTQTHFGLTLEGKEFPRCNRWYFGFLGINFHLLRGILSNESDTETNSSQQFETKFICATKILKAVLTKKRIFILNKETGIVETGVQYSFLHKFSFISLSEDLKHLRWLGFRKN